MEQQCDQGELRNNA